MLLLLLEEVLVTVLVDVVWKGANIEEMKDAEDDDDNDSNSGIRSRIVDKISEDSETNKYLTLKLL